MLFVQEENFGTLASDVADTNGITVSFRESAADLAVLQEAYDTLLTPFAENKEAVTSEVIIAFIGEKITFD